jgi:hypothetical protein
LTPRLRLAIAGAVVLVLLYAIVGFFIVPRLIRSQIVSQTRGRLHREARVDDVRFNPFTLTTTIAGLRIVDRDDADLLRLERLRVNFELSGIFRRAWRFSEIRIERPDLSARILSDGKPSVADLLSGDPASAGPEPKASEPFTLPRVIVDRLTLNGGVVRFTDASRKPTYESTFTPLNLDITDLITIPQEGGEHALTIGAGRGAQLKWTGHQTVEPLQFTGQFAITGLELSPLWDYFAQSQPLLVHDGRIDLTLPYNVHRGAATPFEVRLDGASARIANLAVRPRNEMAEWLALPELRVAGVNVAWPASSVDVASVTVSRPRVLARLGADGSWNWQHAYSPSPSTSSSDAQPWTYRIAAADLVSGAIHLEAEGSTTPAVDVGDVALHTKNVSSNLAAPIPFTSSARVLVGADSSLRQGSGGQARPVDSAQGALSKPEERSSSGTSASGALEASGSVTPSPLAFNVDFAAKTIDIPSLQPYLSLPSGLQLARGSASLQGNATMTGAQALKATADGSLDDVEVRDAGGEPLARWHAMSLTGFTYDDPPNRARIRNVTFDQPFAKVLIDRQGNLNLLQLRKPASGTPDSGPTDVGPHMPTLEVGTITIRNASAEFSDDSLPQPFGTFGTQIHSANGSIRDLSTFAAAPATVDIEGRVDKTGYVKVGGTLRTSDPMAASEITVGFRSIDMANLSPYFAEFAGYRVKTGVLDLDVKYQVVSRRLIGNHKLVARDLAVGERVKDSKAPGLAIRLAIALLKDREGRINLDVPIEGTVDSPEFDYSKVFWGAVRTILGNAAKAPFRALGRLFGRDEDDLELVEFDPGRSDLLPADQEMLARLSDQLVERRELSLAIEGRFDPKTDTPALKRAKLEELIDTRRSSIAPPAAADAAAPGRSALETILETLFSEQFSAEALQAERARFSAPPAASSGAQGGAGGAPAATSGVPGQTPAASGTVPSPGAPTPAAGAANAGGPASTPAPLVDAAGFYESLRTRLLDAQPVSQDDLNALATARAATIVGLLTKAPAVDASRITTAAPALVKRSKKDSSRVASEMTMKVDGDE